MDAVADSTTTPLQRKKRNDGLYWCEISRNGVPLVTAGSTSNDEALRKAARKLVQCPVTPGFEFWVPPAGRLAPTGLRRGTAAAAAAAASPPPRRLYGIKFHVHDHFSKDDDDDDDDNNNNNDEDNVNSKKDVLWVYAVVYDRNRLTPLQVQRWLGMVVETTTRLRDQDDIWKYGGADAAQDTFGPELCDLIRDRAYHETKGQLEAQVDSLRAIMQRNIEGLLDREAKIERLHERAMSLEDMAKVFRKRARSLKCFHMWQHAKYGVLMGTAVTAAVAVVAVPVLVVIF